MDKKCWNWWNRS